MTKLAIFDVDGTLFNGTLGIELVKKLVNDKVFTDEIGNEIFEWYKKYKNGEIDKAIAVDACYENYNLGLKNKSTSEIENIAQHTWNLIKNKTFLFTGELIEFVQKEDYHTVLLTGSPLEMVKLFGNEYHINNSNIIAGVSEIKDDVYTGKSLFYPSSSELKVQAIHNYISNKNLTIDWNNSIGMGDNERDAGILKLVANAFAINPNDELQKIALENKYHLVNETNALKKVKEVIGYNANK